MNSKKPLTMFKLVMMAVVAIDSLKNLPTNAQYGSHLIIYYALAILIFFIPSALVSAELATTWPATGGIYVWVREAFNKRMAFLIVWMQWLIAITWYPTILSFIAATLACLISSELALNKIYIFFTIQILFWSAIFLVCKGIRLSSLVSTLSAVIGVIIPMIFFIVLGLSWIWSGHHSEIKLIEVMKTEKMVNSDSLRLFITLLYSLMGMEMIAMHAGDVKNPQKNYPRALFWSAIIILATVIPSSLAIAMVVPTKQISLTTGVIEALTIFLQAFHLEWLKPILIISVVIGSFGIFLTWLLAASRCLLLAAEDGSLPRFLKWTNRHDMPVAQLLLQGLIISALSSVFVFMSSVNSAFWLLSAAAAQFALLYYVFLFAAAIRLRYKYKNLHRPFQVGKHPFILWITCGVAIATCLLAFGFGFLPPPEMTQSQIFKYELLLSGIILGGGIVGWFIYFWCQEKTHIDTELSDIDYYKSAGLNYCKINDYTLIGSKNEINT